jgi:ABC-2 type transport system permease protein
VNPLFSYFLSSQVKSRKTLLLFVAGILPVCLAFLITVLHPLLGRDFPFTGGFFLNFTFLVYLHFLVPLIALFQGTGIIADEVEDRTLPFLLVRPVPRYSIVLMKYLALLAISTAIIIFSLLMTYLILTLGSPSQPNATNPLSLLQCGGVLLLELAVYQALFTFLGGVMRRSVVVGLLYLFGWEKLISQVPGNAQLITVMNYLQELFPDLPLIRLIDFALFASPVSDVAALVVLFVLLVAFCAASSLLPSLKEYIPEVE